MSLPLPRIPGFQVLAKLLADKENRGQSEEAAKAEMEKLEAQKKEREKKEKELTAEIKRWAIAFLRACMHARMCMCVGMHSYA